MRDIGKFDDISVLSFTGSDKRSHMVLTLHAHEGGIHSDENFRARGHGGTDIVAPLYAAFKHKIPDFSTFPGVRAT